MILALRFVERQGRKILQQAETARIESGEMVYDWVDVPYEGSGDASSGSAEAEGPKG